MTSILTDPLDPTRARAMQVTLGQRPTIGAGDPLPPFFHHLYFWDLQPPARLGRDGHPAPGVTLADTGLPRRMWAGGAVEWVQPLRAGQRAERRSYADEVVRKTGRSGKLAFIAVHHEVWQDDELCVAERQDIVYREDPSPDDPQPDIPVAPTGEDTAETRQFSEVTLFRYSALTFNGHRIHYDQDYATGIEGHKGVVVHGPLLAQHLMLMAAPLGAIAYRMTSPVVVGEEVTFCQKGKDLWAKVGDRLVCSAETA